MRAIGGYDNRVDSCFLTAECCRAFSRKNSKMNPQVGRVVVNFLLAVAIFCSLEPRAYAYVDPGTGLLACQSMSAMVAGVLFYFRRGLMKLFVRSSSEINPNTGKNGR